MRQRLKGGIGLLLLRRRFQFIRTNHKGAIEMSVQMSAADVECTVPVECGNTVVEEIIDLNGVPLVVDPFMGMLESAS